MLKKNLSLLIICGLLTSAPAVFGAPSVRVEGNSWCPDKDAVCRELALLGLVCAYGESPAWRVELSAQGDDTLLQMWDGNGEPLADRVLQVSACADRGALAAVIVEGAFVELGAMPPATAASQAVASLRAQARTQRPGRKLHLGLLGGGVAGLDETINRVEVAAEVGWLGARGVWGSGVVGGLSTASLGRGAQRVELAGGRAHVRVGWGWPWGAGRLDSGVFLGAAVQQKSAPEAAVVTRTTRLSPETGLLVGGGWPMSRSITLRAELVGLLAIFRDRLTVEGVGTVAVEPRFQALFRVGVRWEP